MEKAWVDNDVEEVEQSSNSSRYNNDNNNIMSYDENEAEITARFSDKSVLIKIMCEMQKGTLINILTRIESLHLLISSVNCMAIHGTTTFHATIVAQMETGFKLSSEDIVNDLHSTIV